MARRKRTVIGAAAVAVASVAGLAAVALTQEEEPVPLAGPIALEAPADCDAPAAVEPAPVKASDDAWMERRRAQLGGRTGHVMMGKMINKIQIVRGAGK